MTSNIYKPEKKSDGVVDKKMKTNILYLPQIYRYT